MSGTAVPRRVAFHILLGMAFGLAASAMAMLAGLLPIAGSFESLTYDWRLRSTARMSDARPDIAIILIDEGSIRQLEPRVGAWPWPRLLHAGVIDFLARARARIIAYDVLFLERDTRAGFSMGGSTLTGDESDAELTAAVKRAGNVVLLAEATFQSTEGATEARVAVPGPAFHAGTGFEPRPSLKLPFPGLAEAAIAIGHNFQVKEADGTARRIRPFVDYQGTTLPSLGIAAAIEALGLPPDAVVRDADALRIGGVRMPLLDAAVPARPGERPLPSRQALLNFHGPYQTASGRTTYPVYSFFNVLLAENQLSSGDPPAIDPAVFRDKIVFVGTSAAGLSDVWSTPFGGAGMPGVQLHAAAADDVLSGRFMKRASRSADAGVTIALSMIVGVLSAVLPVTWAVIAAVVVAAGVAAWLTQEVGRGVWIAAVVPAAAMALALFEGVAWQYFVEGRAKREIKRLFGRYVSKDVFDQLTSNPDLARLGGQRREMTVLFSDIRGFTTASERGAPEDIVQQLNEYFSVMVEVLFRHHGTLDKFVGDMVMGLFGAPLPDPAHADHAVAAACEMTTALAALNGRWTAAGRPALDIGIGINSGEMIAGNIGSEQIMSYTVIGDAVNLGSRLESLNKEFGTHILISEATRRLLTIRVETRPVGEVTVKGRTQPVMVHEVVRGAAAS